MKSVHIICSIKNLNYDFEHLQWLRMFLMSNGYKLSEDWINHSLNIRNNKPYFKAAPNFDYMKVATQSINSSDKIIILMSSPSTFSLTMLRYALHVGKEPIVICRSRSFLRKIHEDKKHLVNVLNYGTYQKRIKELL